VDPIIRNARLRRIEGLRAIGIEAGRSSADSRMWTASGGLTAVKAPLEFKREYPDFCDLQVVAFPEGGRIRDAAAAKHLDEGVVMKLCREAGMAVVRDAVISLMLMNRRDQQLTPRGIARAKELLQIDANVLFGQYGACPTPFWCADMLEVASYTAHAGPSSRYPRRSSSSTIWRRSAWPAL
jgi:hypothetical protein